jgi:hypothetical protein
MISVNILFLIHFLLLIITAKIINVIFFNNFFKKIIEKKNAKKKIEEEYINFVNACNLQQQKIQNDAKNSLNILREKVFNTYYYENKNILQNKCIEIKDDIVLNNEELENIKKSVVILIKKTNDNFINFKKGI